MTSALTQHYICQECKSPLIETESGSVCPNGHGFVQGYLPTEIRRRNHAIVAIGVRDLHQLPGGRFVFDIGGQLYEQTKGTRAITRVLNEWPAELGENEELGFVDGTKIIRLTPVDK